MTTSHPATGVTQGLVCSHHHLYSALARGMPSPPMTPSRFVEVLQQVWWRLDVALDHEMLEWSAKLGAAEALMAGCTGIVDHHESPNAIDGSLDVIAEACAEVGVRVACAYGVTDRHGLPGARAGLAENERFLKNGGRGFVGLHAAFTCSDATVDAAVGLSEDLGVGLHVHVAEGLVDAGRGSALARRSTEDWVLAHGVHLPDGLPVEGTIVHNPRSNMNNSVGYAAPARFRSPVALGTDGIGADMVEEFRLAFARHREVDLTASPEVAWGWLMEGRRFFPESENDAVTWSYPDMEPWHLAYTTGIRVIDVDVDGEPVVRDGLPTRVDLAEVRAKAGEQAQRLFRALEV